MHRLEEPMHQHKHPRIAFVASACTGEAVPAEPEIQTERRCPVALDVIWQTKNIGHWMLRSLHRPDRHAAALTTSPFDSTNRFFEFDSKYFLNEIFNVLPDVNTDTSQLELALVHDDFYYESPECDRQAADRDAKPISTDAFLVLLNQLIELLDQELARQPEDRLSFRTPPEEHKEVLLRAREFLIQHSRCALYLVTNQVI